MDNCIYKNKNNYQVLIKTSDGVQDCGSYSSEQEARYMFRVFFRVWNGCNPEDVGFDVAVYEHQEVSLCQWKLVRLS